MGASPEEEFRDFVAGRAHTLLKAAYALTGDRHAAEDLVQSALAKTFARWRRISEPEPYIRRMIYHDFVSDRRSRKRRPEVVVAEPPERSDFAGLESEAALRLLMRDALLALPPRQRAVLVLRYFEDLSLAETAAALSCREGTVASQASRALAKLRELVPDLWPAAMTGGER
ncbi:SigE family RNA polymerase sigma factor [Hamadaea tsunoensis]|uniref:SigE family RNA polymerase sigma factor n=1 Tax=Hamadaea tsunoensis TaxID=53368 RepID=UPI00040FB531|nr:SigE family RNA polymerase sigma factor [Hamadaea tsunoensis]